MCTSWSLQMSPLYLCIVKCQKQSSAISEEDLHSIISELPPAFVHLLYLLISPAEGCRLCLSLRNLLIKKKRKKETLFSLSHVCADTYTRTQFSQSNLAIAGFKHVVLHKVHP